MSRQASEAERMIAQSVLDFAEDAGGLRRARSLRDRGTPFDAGVWRAMAELGWMGICVPEARGGLGLGVREMCVLLETAGRKLVPEPLAGAMAAAQLLAACEGSDAPRILARLLAGEITCRPVSAGDGALRDVPEVYGDALLLVGGRTGEGFTVRALEVGGPGVSLERARCVDGSELASVPCPGDAMREAPPIATGARGGAAFEAAMSALRLGDAAYLVGLMDEALRMSITYLSGRIQFGVPLASFQALQHRAASCYVDVTATRALVYEACRAFGTVQQTRASAAAKARASAAALRVTKECIQFHGSPGFADEFDIGLYLRRAMAVAARGGGEIENERLFAER